MVKLSMNVLTAALTLLERIETYRFSSLSELAYSKIISISVEDIFVFSSNCGWVSEDEDALSLTKRGRELLQLQVQGSFVALKRQMLMDHVLKSAPVWSKRIPSGRREATIFMTKDEKACFSEAGLLSDHPDPEIVDWWDTAAAHIRALPRQVKNKTGRLGEQSTIQYEKARTGFEPIWMSIDSNLAGYDIKSQVDEDNSDALLIEVKASTCALEKAAFHVTSHEWDVARTSTAYVFHLWCLSSTQKLLAVISSDELLPYIPTNNLAGQWESARIPFSCFKEKFVEIA